MHLPFTVHGDEQTTVGALYQSLVPLVLRSSLPCLFPRSRLEVDGDIRVSIYNIHPVRTRIGKLGP